MRSNRSATPGALLLASRLDANARGRETDRGRCPPGSGSAGCGRTIRRRRAAPWRARPARRRAPHPDQDRRARSASAPNHAGCRMRSRCARRAAQGRTPPASRRRTRSATVNASTRRSGDEVEHGRRSVRRTYRPQGRASANRRARRRRRRPKPRAGRHSTSTWRKSRARPAPSASRSENSWRRAADRASTRLPTFAQAMRRTMPATLRRMKSGCENCRRRSERPVAADVRPSRRSSYLPGELVPRSPVGVGSLRQRVELCGRLFERRCPSRGGRGRGTRAS